MKNQEPTNLEILDFLQEHMLTKEEAFLTFATKDDLINFATKDDLKRFATKDDLINFATKDDIFEIKEELKTFAKKDDLLSMERRITGIVDDFITSQRKFDIELISIRHRVSDHEERIHTIETTK